MTNGNQREKLFAMEKGLEEELGKGKLGDGTKTNQDMLNLCTDFSR